LSLYNNIFFRFTFIFFIIFQSLKDLTLTLIYTISVMIFFYIIGDKEDREQYLSNNFNTNDLRTLLYFLTFGLYLNKIGRIFNIM
jgi:hypothetical protein